VKKPCLALGGFSGAKFRLAKFSPLSVIHDRATSRERNLRDAVGLTGLPRREHGLPKMPFN
jgi:hypothetical protein